MLLTLLIASFAISLLGWGTYLRHKAMSLAAAEVGKDHTTYMKNVHATPRLNRTYQTGLALHLLAVLIVVMWILLRK
ncbi:hypothetical protein EV672_106254 [Aquabacterium commune]|uniref:Uncharacterized protein n=1 Tax=Aquabacterium commune TaxID=70586 RepID=A0A4R6R8E4_9BURK|nr:hypothetical protein [Aquabacterium commune]TDP82291.1 hypothetical protein EV672_106254 [Aquabacterium commune]